MSQRTYNTGNIRELLNASFTAEELRQLCYDEFKPVHQKLAEETGKSRIIYHLIEYCEIQMQMDRLLAIVQKKVPGQYAKFENDLIVGGKKAEPASTPNPVAMPNETEFLQQLLTQKTRELYDLKLKAAQFGALHTPPYINLRIEDLEKEIDELKQKLYLKR